MSKDKPELEDPLKDLEGFKEDFLDLINSMSNSEEHKEELKEVLPLEVYLMNLNSSLLEEQENQEGKEIKSKKVKTLW